MRHRDDRSRFAHALLARLRSPPGAACTKPARGPGRYEGWKKTLKCRCQVFWSLSPQSCQTYESTPLEAALASPGRGGASPLPISRCDGALHEKGVLRWQLEQGVVSSVSLSSVNPAAHFSHSLHPPELELWSSSWDAQTHHMHLDGAGNEWGATCICIRSVSHLPRVNNRRGRSRSNHVNKASPIQSKPLWVCA